MNLFLYLDEQTWLHRIDPRVKFFAVFCVVFTALAEQELLPLLFLFFVITGTGLGAGFARNLRRMAPILISILLMSACIWGLTTRTSLIWGIFSTTGLFFGLITGIKLLIMIIAGLVWLSTTRIEEMALGMEKLGVPRPVAFSFSTSVRMIPCMVRNVSTICDAQQSRGMDLSTGSVPHRIRNYILILIPALVSVIRSTKQFAIALETRGYSCRGNRSSYLDLRISSADLVFLSITILVVLAGLVINTLPWMDDVRVFLTLIALVIVFIAMTRLSVQSDTGRFLWGNMRMVVLTAFSAALYAAVAIPFKGLVIIPGAVDFRPANALVPVLGFLFGPAGAWGSGMGCMISDLFGTLSPGTFFGFVGNFTMAWITYHLWMKTGLVLSSDPEPFQIQSLRKKGNFFILAVLGAVACSLIIAWGVALLGLLPFTFSFIVILINNLVPILLLSVPLVILLYPRIKAWGLFWTDVVGPEGMRRNLAGSYAGTFLVITGICVGALGAVFGEMVIPGHSLLLAGTGILLMIIGYRL